MRWRVLPIALLLGKGVALMSSARKLELRELTLDMLRHANGNYRRVAFPADELLPLSCSPQQRDSLNPEVRSFPPLRPVAPDAPLTTPPDWPLRRTWGSTTLWATSP